MMRSFEQPRREDLDELDLLSAAEGKHPFDPDRYDLEKITGAKAGSRRLFDSTEQMYSGKKSAVPAKPEAQSASSSKSVSVLEEKDCGGIIGSWPCNTAVQR